MRDSFVVWTGPAEKGQAKPWYEVRLKAQGERCSVHFRTQPGCGNRCWITWCRCGSCRRSEITVCMVLVLALQLSIPTRQGNMTTLWAAQRTVPTVLRTSHARPTSSSFHSSIASEIRGSPSLPSTNNSLHFGYTRLYNDIHTVSICVMGASK